MLQKSNSYFKTCSFPSGKVEHAVFNGETTVCLRELPSESRLWNFSIGQYIKSTDLDKEKVPEYALEKAFSTHITCKQCLKVLGKAYGITL